MVAGMITKDHEPHDLATIAIKHMRLRPDLSTETLKNPDITMFTDVATRETRGMWSPVQ